MKVFYEKVEWLIKTIRFLDNNYLITLNQDLTIFLSKELNLN